MRLESHVLSLVCVSYSIVAFSHGRAEINFIPWTWFPSLQLTIIDEPTQKAETTRVDVDYVLSSPDAESPELSP